MKKIILLIFILAIQACAFTDAKLQVQHDPSSNFSGPINGVESLAFLAPNLIDSRTDKVRIGWKKNGYGAKTADITTTEPVETIVSEGIKTGLTQNGHTILDNGRVKIQGAVDRFWFETDMNFWTIEFTGEVQCTVSFIDTESQKEIYKSNYSGTYSEKKGAGLNKTWQRIMSKAVDNLVEDIMFDEDLSEALENL